MGDSTTPERVQQRVEAMAQSALNLAIARHVSFEHTNPLARLSPDEPIELRDVNTGYTFMLEVRALPTGG